MSYVIRLMDSGKFADDQRQRIEARYAQALAQNLGGTAEVVQARRAWVQARTRQDEITGADISMAEKKAILHWENAETAARLLAFEGYTGALEDLYIEVRLDPA